MTLEKQGWIGFVYGLVACLALIVMMGHTFKKDAVLDRWDFIGPSSQSVALKNNQILGTYNTSRVFQNLVGMTSGNLVRLGSGNEPNLIGDSTASVVGAGGGNLIIQHNLNGGLRTQNAAGTVTLKIFRIDATNNLVYGNSTNRMVIESSDVGTKFLEVGAADSCGVGFRCLRVIN